MSKTKIATFDSTIAGIPCGILVESYLSVPPWKGSAYDCPSDLDYYGYCEFDFTVLDRKGYVADWLTKKMTDDDFTRIQKEYEDIINS